MTDGKILRLVVDDEPFDVRYGHLRAHERELDLRGGVLRREVGWVSPAGKAVHISSVRLVSFVHRGVAAIRYVVEPVGADARVVVQSELVANEPVPVATRDPRAAAALSTPLEAESWGHGETSALLSHLTRASGLRVTAGMDHVVTGPNGTGLGAETSGRITVTANLRRGQRLEIVKFLAYGWSAAWSLPAVRSQAAALTEARHTGWDGFVAGQADYLEEFWAGADVELDGDPETTPTRLLLHFPYFELYRKQVVKQADLVLALHLRGDAFTDDEKARDFAYYEARTLRDSSLSACTQAVVAAEVGHLQLAYDYLGAAALMDLHDLQTKHAGRCPHGLARGRLARPRGRFWRDAGPRREADRLPSRSRRWQLRRRGL